MKPRGTLSFSVFRRSYATRRPERPPPKVIDPLLTSPNATVSKLPEGVTFIHRPPPTSPSPFSTTILPASPLLRPPTPLPSSPASSSSAPAPDGLVPPRSRNPRKYENNVLVEEDFAKMRELRAADPVRWTRGALAKEFRCPPFLVAQQVPLGNAVRKSSLAKREEEHEKNRSKWGEQKSMVMAIRKKRREFW